MYTIVINGEVKYTRAYRPNGLWMSTVRTLECEGGSAVLLFNGECLQSAGDYPLQERTEADETASEEARLLKAAAAEAVAGE